MKDISLEDLKATAEELAANGAPWHFHVVTSACNILPYRSGVVFVLEDSAAGGVYSADATEADLDAGAYLLGLLHPGVTDKQPTVPEGSLNSNDELVAKAREYLAAGTHWHHHVLFPDCEFNPSPGHWTVTLEGDDEIMQESFAEQPKALIQEIEPLFYSQKSVG